MLKLTLDKNSLGLEGLSHSETRSV